jgi:uncharacterized membrane protein
VLQKAHCFSSGWNTPDQFWHACYSDLPLSYLSWGFGQATPYVAGAKPLDQPVLSGLMMRAVALAVPDGSALVQQQWYFALWAVLITVIVIALVAATAASVPADPWRAAHVALSPVLVLAGLVSPDLFGVLLASLALLAWGRGKVLTAGLLFGLAIAARTYPLILLAAIGMLAVRTGTGRAWAKTAVAALATWFAVSLPWLVVNADGLLSVYRSWWRAGASYGSIWIVPTLLKFELPQGSVTRFALIGWVLALVVGGIFALTLDRRPTIAEISLVMLVIVMVTGKAMPVQAGLWLLPLIALVGIKWRDHLIWAGVEATYFVAVWLYIAGLSTPNRGLPARGYSLLLGVRVAAWLYLLAQVWLVARSRPPADRPDWEDLSAVGADVETDAEATEAKASEAAATGAAMDEWAQEELDPLAGPMAGAPDQLIVRVS